MFFSSVKMCSLKSPNSSSKPEPGFYNSCWGKRGRWFWCTVIFFVKFSCLSNCGINPCQYAPNFLTWGMPCYRLLAQSWKKKKSKRILAKLKMWEGEMKEKGLAFYLLSQICQNPWIAKLTMIFFWHLLNFTWDGIYILTEIPLISNRT